MISWAWGRRSMGKTRSKSSGSIPQPPAISGVSDDVAGGPPLAGFETVGYIGGRVDRQPVLAGDDRMVVVDGPVASERIPEGDGHPEEALPAHQPVAVEALHPALVAGLHVGRVPAQLPAPGGQ